MPKLPKVGGLYRLSMHGEADFGGVVRVQVVTDVSIRASFEINGWKDDGPDLAFKVEEGRVFYTPVARDTFPAAEVKFRLIKEKRE